MEETNNITVKEFFIEEKQVTEIKALDVRTPLGDPIFLVSFAEGESIELSQAKFEAIRTIEKSDATTARNTLVKEIGTKMYAVLMEYGILMSEVDPVLNETVRLANDGQTEALNILWGKDQYTRSLLDVNRVLLTNYVQPEKTETPEGDNGAAPDGSPVDTENKD